MSAPGWPPEPTGSPVPRPGLPPPTLSNAVPPVAPTQPLPTIPPPPPVAAPPPPPSQQLQPPRNRRAAAIVGGVVAAVALGAGAFVVLGGDDDSSAPAATTTAVVTPSLDPATTLPPTSVTITTVAATTSTAAATTSTAPTRPIDVGPALLQAMPAAEEVPADWTPFEQPDTDPALNPTSGYCEGPGWAAAAADHGAVGLIHGPNWDLPSGGWFGLSAFTFDSAEAASAYLVDIDLQANGCMTDPVVFESPEADSEIFAEGFGDDAVWSVAEVNASFPGTTADADEMTLVIYEEYISTSYQGEEFSLVRTEFQRFERHGRTVVAFWLWGEHDVAGFGNVDEVTTYVPSEVDLDGAAAVLRSGVVERLRANGLV